MAKRRSSGEGTVFWSDQENTWIAEIVLPDGKKKRKRNKRQKVVKEWLDGQKEAVRDGLLVKNDRMTISQFIDRYMADVGAHTLRPKTQEAYNSLIKIHIKPGIGSIRLSQLQADQLQSFYSAKLNGGLSNRTVQFIHSVIHKALDQAMKWGLVIRNVSDLVEKPSVKRKAPTIWTVAETQKFLKAVEGQRFYPIYVLAVATGMREGEVLAVHFEDIDWSTGTLHVKRAIQYLIGKGLVLTEPKTAKGKRPIPLPEFAIQVLREHCERQNRNQGFIFVTSNITPFSPRNLIRHFKQMVNEIGLPDVTFHAFSRHYHASYLLAQGVNPKVVQERLGHSQISLTMDTYSHTIPSLQAEAARKVNEMFQP